MASKKILKRSGLTGTISILLTLASFTLAQSATATSMVTLDQTDAATQSSASLAPIPADVSALGYKTLAYFDEFSRASTIDYYNTNAGGSNWGNGLWYKVPEPLQNITVANGYMHLQTGVNGAANDITSIKHDTKTGLLFHYGYFEARMRWSGDSSSWPAFWLFSAEHMRGTDKNKWCEIDVFENLASNTFTGTVHDWVPGYNTKNANNNYKFAKPVDWTAWHNYGVLWTSTQITWYFDGIKLMSAPPPATCVAQNLSIVLSSLTHDTTKQQYVDFDWVRVLTYK